MAKKTITYRGYEFSVPKGAVPAFGKPRYLYHPKYGWMEVAIMRVRSEDGKFYYKVDEEKTKKVEERPRYSCVLPRHCAGQLLAERAVVLMQEDARTNLRATMRKERYQRPLDVGLPIIQYLGSLGACVWATYCLL